MCDECARLMPLTLVCTQHSAVMAGWWGYGERKRIKWESRCVWLRCTCQLGWHTCLYSFKWISYQYLNVPTQETLTDGMLTCLVGLVWSRASNRHLLTLLSGHYKNPRQPAWDSIHYFREEILIFPLHFICFPQFMQLLLNWIICFHSEVIKLLMH